MATIDQLERRVRDLEAVVRRLHSQIEDAARYLKRADDDNVQTAGRRLS